MPRHASRLIKANKFEIQPYFRGPRQRKNRQVGGSRLVVLTAVGVYDPFMTGRLVRALHLNNEKRSIEVQQWRIVKHRAG